MGENTPKILFNYKTSNKEELNLIKSIKYSLKSFSIIDRSESEESDWRVNFIKYLGCCDGAVIFLTNEILDQATFYSEIIILFWRHWLENLPITVIALDKSIKDKFTTTPIWPKLSFQQEEIICYSSTDDFTRTLVDKLKFVNKDPLKILDLIQQNLEELLSIEDITLLKKFLFEIAIHNWGDGISLKTQAVYEFLRQGLKIFPNLVSLVQNKLPKDKYICILNIARLSSVELSEAGLLAKILKPSKQTDIFHINSDDKGIAVTYIQKALHSKYDNIEFEFMSNPPRTMIKWIEITHTIDPITQIRSELFKFKPFAKKKAECIDGLSDQKIDDILKSFLDSKFCIFVVLVDEKGCGLSETIHNTYKYLPVVIFRGKNINNGKYLEIIVSEEQKKALKDTYDKCDNHLNMLFEDI